MGTRHVPEYSPAQVELMQLIMMHGPDELSRSLRRIHDMALYFSDVPLEDDEKSALYDVKLLSDFIDQVVEIPETPFASPQELLTDLAEIAEKRIFLQAAT